MSDWKIEREVESEEGTQKVIELEVMYLSRAIRLARRIDTMRPGVFAVERWNDEGYWEVEADPFDLKLLGEEGE
jgi:hypothetical protein